MFRIALVKKNSQSIALVYRQRLALPWDSKGRAATNNPAAMNNAPLV
jgi:hypothetical protein